MRPTRAEEYRRKASQCAESARLLSDPEAKRVLTEIANRWVVMADRVERDDEEWSRTLGQRFHPATGPTRWRSTISILADWRNEPAPPLEPRLSEKAKKFGTISIPQRIYSSGGF